MPPYRQRLVLEPEPQLTLRPSAGQRRPQLLRRGLQVELAHLRLGSLDVPEVGQEAARVGADDGERVAAGEARQVAHVDEVGDQQKVELVLGEPGGDAIGPAHSASRSRSSATR
jgi:hypothetical protein